MEYEITARHDRVAVLTIDRHEAAVLRLGLGHGLTGREEALRVLLRGKLAEIEEALTVAVEQLADILESEAS